MKTLVQGIFAREIDGSMAQDYDGEFEGMYIILDSDGVAATRIFEDDYENHNREPMTRAEVEALGIEIE